MDLKEAIEVAVDVSRARQLTCEMTKDCTNPVSWIDNKGFVYCAHHGQRRRSGGIPARPLRPGEIKKLESGVPVKYGR